MKKIFEIPEIEILLLEVEDVICASGDDDTTPGENETPEW